MTALKKVPRLLCGATVLAAITGLAAGVAPAAASPAQNGATLYVYEDPRNHDNFRVSIKGVFPMQQPDAVGFLTHINDGNHPGGPGPGGMIYHLEADDGNGWPNDTSIASGFFPGAQVDGEGYLKAGPDGLEYLREISVPKNKFNEDDGLVNEEDEIYAVAQFRDGDGGGRTQFSQQIVRYFEVPAACTSVCT
jgi:hypothetical protein